MIQTIKSIGITVYIISILLLSSCVSVRTEFYRNETQYLYEEGVKLYKSGEYETARNNFEETIVLDPDYGPAHAALGNLAMIREDYRQAYIHYQEAIKHDPELKEEILPLLLTSDSYQQRAPLRKAGVSLASVYELLLASDFEGLNQLLKKDFPLELLAKDNLTLTPGELGELRYACFSLTNEMLSSYSSVSKMLIAYILFYSDTDHEQTITFVTALTQDTKIQSEAYVLLGRALERVGQKNRAVDAYLNAVKTGKSFEDVSHYLARLYEVDIATVLPDKEKNTTITAPTPVPIQFELAVSESSNSETESLIYESQEQETFTKSPSLSIGLQ